MLNFVIVIVVLCAIIMAEEMAWKNKLLHDEYQRKFVHITNGTFMAFWPWLLTWGEIQIIAGAGVIAAMVYKRVKILNGLDNIRHNGFGHFTHPLSVFVAASLTTNKAYFCIAVLVMALSDGLAAVAGQRFGKQWQYKVFGHTKTVIGSMTFWLVSLVILGVGLLTVRQNFSFSHYVALMAIAPPILTAIENVGVLGIDNLLLPPAVLLMLSLAQS